jgi:hypothetical protein
MLTRAPALGCRSSDSTVRGKRTEALAAVSTIILKGPRPFRSTDATGKPEGLSSSAAAAAPASALPTATTPARSSAAASACRHGLTYSPGSC